MAAFDVGPMDSDQAWDLAAEINEKLVFVLEHTNDELEFFAAFEMLMSQPRLTHLLSEGRFFQKMVVKLRQFPLQGWTDRNARQRAIDVAVRRYVKRIRSTYNEDAARKIIGLVNG